MSEPAARTCSEDCLAGGEPLAGTASDARFFAAISWPKALWHHDKVAQSEGLPESVGALEKSARAAGQKLQLRLFQRAGAVSTSEVEVVCADFATRRTAHHRGVPAPHAAELVTAFLAGDAQTPPLEEPLALVCTDGKHDACCGKLGRSLVSALRADGRVAVAEVSHIGGHRFAANCLALPSGRLYGRLGVLDAPALAEAIRHDRVYLRCYRGRNGLGEREQVEEAAGHAGDAAVSFTRRPFSAIASCGDAEPELRERWVVQSATEKEL